MNSRRRSMLRGRNDGFTYIGILLTITLLGTALAAMGQSWSLLHRRTSELDLILVGQAYRRAIASYYSMTPLGAHQYPTSLGELIADSRGGKVERHLRQLYSDPVNGSADWETISLPDGSIIGVASRSDGHPLKQRNFGAWEAAFENASCYCDWQFVYLPQLVNSSGLPP